MHCIVGSKPPLMQLNPSSMRYRTERWLLTSSSRQPERPALKPRLVPASANLRCEYAVSVVRGSTLLTTGCQWSVAFSGPWRIYRVFLAAPLRDHRAGLPPGLRPSAPPGAPPPPAASLDWRRRNGRTISTPYESEPV